MGRHWIIYGLADNPDMEGATDLVWYIGKSEDPYRRVREHTFGASETVAAWKLANEEVIAEAAANGRYLPAELREELVGDYPEPFTWTLAMHWEEGMLPKVVILEEGVGDDKAWRERERFWIEAAKKLGLYLYNKTNGG